jgi:outer membrane lipoprotein SlyB
LDRRRGLMLAPRNGTGPGRWGDRSVVGAAYHGGVTDTQVQERIEERTDVRLDEGDSGQLAHIIRKADQMRAYVGGEAVTALCGKRWVPTRDPEKYPVCPECRIMFDAITGGAGGGDRS